MFTVLEAVSPEGALRSRSASLQRKWVATFPLNKAVCEPVFAGAVHARRGISRLGLKLAQVRQSLRGAVRRGVTSYSKGTWVVFARSLRSAQAFKIHSIICQ
jgi:hypothetical protein